MTHHTEVNIICHYVTVMPLLVESYALRSWAYWCH